ncbi:MAG TPA: hypothetical protein VJT31_18180, partial [Rugosimonospora sp.]|nr:hypothetical protein [Rugosimonospora sp.]
METVLGPEDVGYRVVVRRIVGIRDNRPVFSDTLGHLLRVDEYQLTVQTASGQVRVPVESVTSGLCRSFTKASPMLSCEPSLRERAGLGRATDVRALRAFLSLFPLLLVVAFLAMAFSVVLSRLNSRRHE